MLSKKNYCSCFFAILVFISLVSITYFILCHWYPDARNTVAFAFPSYSGNSDVLYPPTLAHDLIYRNNSLLQWILTPTPYLFPDVAVHMLIASFSKNIALNLSIYAVLQIFTLITVLSLLLTTITKKFTSWYVSILITILILLLSEIRNNVDLELFFTIVYGGLHFSGFVAALVSLWIFIVACNQDKWYLGILFFVFTSILIFSDPIVAVYFAIPLLIAMLFSQMFNYIPKNTSIKMSLLLIATILCGYLLFKYMPLIYRRPEKIIHYNIHYVRYFLELMLHFFKLSPAIGSLWLLFVLCAPFSLMRTSFKKSISLPLHWVIIIILFELITIFFTIPFFIITDPDLADINTGYYGLRHLQFLILGPVLLGIPLLLYKHVPYFKYLNNKILCSCCFIFVIIFSLYSAPKINFFELFNFYPKEIRCFDENAKRLHLHAGVTNYWMARPFTVYNHSNIQFIPVTQDFSYFLWITSLAIFKNKSVDFIQVKSPSFQFDKSVILSRFGQPEVTFSCGPNFEYYVYHNNNFNNAFTKNIILDNQFLSPLSKKLKI
jgi:hypothetical protein